MTLREPSNYELLIDMPKSTCSFFIIIFSINLMAVCVAVGVNNITGVDIYDEIRKGGFITILSVLQLLAISRISFKIYNVRRKNILKSTNYSSYRVWAIISLAFLFLATDELIKVHENIDDFIHEIFNLQETSLSDRIDDILIGLYGVTGIGVIIAYKDEFKGYQGFIPFLFVGFILLFLMVIIDVITNRNDILPLIFNDGTSEILYVWLSFSEDPLKLFSEVFFLTAFVSVWNETRLMEK
jgi:hypothetical protein